MANRLERQGDLHCHREDCLGQPFRLILGKMTDAKLVSHILRLHQAGEPLNITAVKRTHPELIEAAYSHRPYLGWRQALELAGPGYHGIVTEFQAEVKCPLCGRDFKLLPIHLKHRHQLTSEEFLEDFPGYNLFSEARQAIRSPAPSALPHWEKIWTREYVLDRIWQWYLREGHCNMQRIADLDPNLTSVIFSPRMRSANEGETWDEALRSLGLDPEEQRLLASRRKYATREEVTAAIAEFHRRGESLTMSQVNLHHTALYRASVRLFGGWRNALKAAGLDGLRTKWHHVKPHSEPAAHLTKRAVVDALRTRHDRDASLDSEVLLAEDPELIRSIYRQFTRWEEALRAARLVAVARRQKKKPRYSASLHNKPHLVLDAIREMHERGGDMRSQAITRGHPGLMNNVIRFFRSWPVARDMAGIAFDTMPDSVRGRHLKEVFRPTARAQTADEAITAIRERSGDGHSLLGKRVIAEDKRLYNDAFHLRLVGEGSRSGQAWPNCMPGKSGGAVAGMSFRDDGEPLLGVRRPSAACRRADPILCRSAVMLTPSGSQRASWYWSPATRGSPSTACMR